MAPEHILAEIVGDLFPGPTGDRGQQESAGFEDFMECFENVRVKFPGNVDQGVGGNNAVECRRGEFDFGHVHPEKGAFGNIPFGCVEHALRNIYSRDLKTEIDQVAGDRDTGSEPASRTLARS